MFIWILFLHWVGDFLLQSGKVAAKKHKDFSVLCDHICIYWAVLGIGTAFSLPWGHDTIPWIGGDVNWMAFMVINCFAHLALDFGSSKLTAYLYSKNRIHDFFTVIGFDQFLHVALLYLTYTWLT